MNIEKFLTQYKVNNNKDEFVKKHIVDKYIPYAEKVAHCENIVNKSSYINVDNNTKIFKVNTPVRQVIFNLTLISLYTDIDIDFSNGFKCFDSLNKEHAIPIILANIPETEFIEFSAILTMVEDDFEVNERDFISYIDTKLTALGMFTESFSNLLDSDKIKELIEKL